MNKILIATHHLLNLAGSELFTATLVKELAKHDFKIVLYAKYINKEIIKVLGLNNIYITNNVNEIKNLVFDIAHVQHNIISYEVRYFFPQVPIIFVSHGVLPFLEQPPRNDLSISKYLCVSDEVKNNLILKGINKRNIEVYHNIVDENIFYPQKEINSNPKRALILSSRITIENETIIRKSCEILNIECEFIGSRFKIVPPNLLAKKINECDIVFSLGRGIIETMMCGRIPVVYDYLGGDGLLTPKTVMESIKCNFSGRRYKKEYTVEELTGEINKYDKKIGEKLQNYAVNQFGSKSQTKKILHFYKGVINDKINISDTSKNKIEEVLNIIQQTHDYTLEAIKLDIQNNLNPVAMKKGESPLVTFIIPVFNNLNFTKKCLEAVGKNTNYQDYEIIIVDNASTDGTKEYLEKVEKENPKFNVITNAENLGFSKANNQAAEIAEGKYLLLLNNDTEVENNWLLPLVEIAENDETVGAVGSKLLFPDRTIQHAGVVFCDDTMKGGDPLAARHIYYQENENFPEANQLRTYRALTAACLLIPKTVYQKFNGLDEGFWNGYEDIDLCLKISEAGYKLVYQPESVVIHYESQSGAERFSKVPENVKRLLNRWGDKKLIDVINEGNNQFKLSEFHAIQKYIPPLRKEENEETVVSIIMLTYNALKYTKKCINSIIDNTDYPYEIIFVDNASNDGSVSYLKGLVKKHDNFHLIENNENKGFAAGNNQGVDVARGKYVMLLNNDVLVSKGWLKQLVHSIEKNEKIGAVGPITNYISGRQMLENIPYKIDSDFYSFSQNILKNNMGILTPRRRLAGFAILMEKTLFEKVDGFDESFGIGNFEDDDLSLKIRDKGYALMVDESVYIHHFGSQSFKANKINYNRNLKERLPILKKKWPNVNYEELIEIKKPLNKEHTKQLKVASEYIQNDEIDTAEEILSKIILLNPICEDTLFGLSLCAFKNNDKEKALNYLKNILNLNPFHSDALNQIGLIAIENGELEKAQSLFIKAIESDQMFIAPQRNLAECLIQMENFNDGVQMYLSILEKCPEDIPTLLRMAELFLEIGEKNNAKEWTEKVLTIDPNNSLAMNYLSVLQ